jgi:hypothetical protein
MSLAGVAAAASLDATACQVAAIHASRATGVPVRLLQALAVVESGLADHDRQLHPWPWTLNINGHGSYRFRSRAAAARYLGMLLAAGIDNVDIGCMQVNWRWQSRAFRSSDDALSPEVNVRYAARLLLAFRRQSGSWAGAVALYHSHTTRRAEDYQYRVATELARIRTNLCSRSSIESDDTLLQ